MGKKAPLDLQELSGERFPDLETAQRLALPGLARDLAAELRALLASGVLVVEEGRIVVNPNAEETKTDE